VRSSVLAVAVLAVATPLVTAAPAVAASRPVCLLSGSIGGPNPAHEGDLVSVRASVSTTSSHRCDATSVRVRSSNWLLCSGSVFANGGGCAVSFAAFSGLSTVTATIYSGGTPLQSRTLGTFTVLPRRPVTSVVVTRTVPRPATSAAHAAVTRTAARTVSASPSKAVANTSFAADTDTPSSGAPSSAAGASATPSASAFAVNVRTDPTGGASPPTAPLLLALVVLAGFVAAAVRFVYAHLHEEVAP
jgi:hypothetical protein